MKLKNALIILKKSKLNYLQEKYSFDQISKSMELTKLNDCSLTHNKNSQKFVENLRKYTTDIEIIADNFLNNDNLTNTMTKQYDYIFSLGGDGTFLRIAQFINNNEQILIGVNTDMNNSFGYYCPLNSENYEKYLNNIFNGDIDYKYYNKLEVIDNQKRYYFINDLYFGEKFLGRISKYDLTVNNKANEMIKSSGIIFSTYSGYSGWIKNANTISFPKFVNLINNISPNKYDIDSILSMYKEKIYIPNYENENSIFYFVREPSLKSNKNYSNSDYLEYLNFMEGTAKLINLKNYCYEGILILDGSFIIPMNYNDEIMIKVGEKKIKTISI